MNKIKHYLRFLLLAFFSLFLSPVYSVTAHAQEEDFLPPEQAFAISTATPTPDHLQIRFNIAPNYYMYMNQVKFKVEGDDEDNRFREALLGEPVFGEPIIKFDETFGQEMPVFYDPMVIDVPLKPVGQAVRLIVTAQGCADAGLCYPPEDYSIDLEPVEGGYKINEHSGLFGRMLGSSKSSSAPTLDFNALAATGATPVAQPEGVEAPQYPNDSRSFNEAGARSLSNAGDTQIADWLDESGFFKIILISFGLGLLLSLTPCVLPMLPILLALVVGQQNQNQGVADNGAKTGHLRFRSLALTLAYVFGTSIIYTLLGIAAASVGAALAVWIQNPWTLSIFAIILVLLAFAMFGSFSIQTPIGMQSKLNRLMDKLPGGRYGSALVMGMLSALIAGPCVAAPLAGVLLFISQTGDMLTGALALFALAWGQGASLIVIGTTSGALMPKAGAWMKGVTQFCGLLLLAVALWMVQPLLPNWLSVLLWAFLAFSLSVVLGAFKAIDAQNSNIFAIFTKAIAYLALVWGILLLIGLGSGQPGILKPLQGFTSARTSVATTPRANDTPAARTAISNADFKRINSLEELEQQIAESAGRPVMLDFYADWCVACHQMEAFTFSVPEVAQKMDQMTLLQADVTPNTAAHRELLKRFRLFGPPGIIFFDAQGNELRDIRVVGFQNAERFSANLDRLLAQ
ncbi:Thiol:disulfide interchange protein DsbD [Oligella sp. MSHR50489EDL]|uniref:protein-disulfide reductase DsbD n=1 Tax=Oligella sp. MSHR50489EDL TaxID=3139409 RepID=UPI003D81BEF4